MYGPSQPSQTGTLSWLLRPRLHSLPCLRNIVFLLLQNQNMTLIAPRQSPYSWVGHFPSRCLTDSSLSRLTRRILFLQRFPYCLPTGLWFRPHSHPQTASFLSLSIIWKLTGDKEGELAASSFLRQNGKDCLNLGLTLPE